MTAGPAEPESGPAFITVADLPGPSGGTRYNHEVLNSWAETGFRVSHLRLPGTWPEASAQDRQRLNDLLGHHRRVLIDGIIASAAPQELSRAADQGAQINVLVHLPLPAESGLTPDQQRRLATGESAALRRAHTVVATSCWAKADLQRRYQLSDVQVAIPGTDHARYAPRPADHAGSTTRQVLFLGAVTPRKNPALLIAALQASRHLPWRCVIAGPHGQDPAYAQELRSACAGDADRFSVPGAVTGPDLEALWQRTELLVLPSRAETYGMVVTEALARGIPAVVGQGTGAEEALRGSPGEERAQYPAPGASADPHSVAEWSAVLGQWLNDPQLRHRWRDRARQHRDRLPGWSQTAADLRRALGW